MNSRRFAMIYLLKREDQNVCCCKDYCTGRGLRQHVRRRRVTSEHLHRTDVCAAVELQVLSPRQCCFLCRRLRQGAAWLDPGYAERSKQPALVDSSSTQMICSFVVRRRYVVRRSLAGWTRIVMVGAGAKSAWPAWLPMRLA